MIAIAEKPRLPDTALDRGDLRVKGYICCWYQHNLDHALQFNSSLVPSECSDACNFFHSPQDSREVLFIVVCQLI